MLALAVVVPSHRAGFHAPWEMVCRLPHLMYRPEFGGHSHCVVCMNRPWRVQELRKGVMNDDALGSTCCVRPLQ